MDCSTFSKSFFALHPACKMINQEYRIERFRQGSPHAQKDINSQSSEHEFLWVLMKLGSPKYFQIYIYKNSIWKLSRSTGKVFDLGLNIFPLLPQVWMYLLKLYNSAYGLLYGLLLEYEEPRYKGVFSFQFVYQAWITDPKTALRQRRKEKKSFGKEKRRRKGSGDGRKPFPF